MTNPQSETVVQAQSAAPPRGHPGDEHSQVCPTGHKLGESDAPVPELREPVGGALREIALDLWQHRDLLYQLTLRDIRIRYKQAIMGFGWAVLMPTLIVLSGVLVRVAAANVSGRQLVTASIAGIAVKAIPWGFFVSALSFSTVSLTGNGTLVSKIYFPREVLPLSTVLAAAVDALIGSTVMVAVLVFLRVAPAGSQLWVIPLAVLLICLTTAAALFFSCANLFFRDVKYIVEIFLTYAIFFTPVLYSVDAVGKWKTVIMLNPIAPLLEGISDTMVEGVAPDYAWLGYSTGFALVVLLAGYWLFKQLESTFAERI